MYSEMEDALKLCWEDMQLQKLPLRGPMLQVQTYEIQSRILQKGGMSMKDSTLTEGTGWLYKFTKRSGLRNVTMSGEATSTAQEMKKYWLN